MSEIPSHAPIRRPLRRTSGLRLSSYRCEAGPHDPSFEEQHAAFSITLVDRGVFSYRNRMGTSVLGPGWLMLGNDGDAYTCSHEHNDGTGDDCIALGMSREIFDAFQETLKQTSGPFGRNCLPPLPRVAGLLKTLAHTGDEGFALEEAALTVIATVQRTLNGGTLPAEPAPQPERALAAARYIETHADEPLSLDRVAATVGLSAFHFVRAFRRAIGITPHQYLVRARLLRAIALLRDTALPVTEVAYASGWADLSNFIRTFHRDVGCAPRDFRNGRKIFQVDHSVYC